MVEIFVLDAPYFGIIKCCSPEGPRVTFCWCICIIIPGLRLFGVEMRGVCFLVAVNHNQS